MTAYERAAGVHPPHDSPGYGSTALRHPTHPLILLPHGTTEITGPLLGGPRPGPSDNDLTRQHEAEPQGQRIIVHGRVLAGGRPVRNTLVEMWQANAAGRYRHAVDNWPAPIDPNFTGLGRVLTDDDGHYSFTTIRPGAYPWGNHHNAWRPAHLHFSLLGEAFTQRLITQMYFPGDPLLPLDPIFNAIPDERVRNRLVSRFDIDATQPNWALGFRFDIVLRGPDSTPVEEGDQHDD
jgi:protocatechuate 3,4-dioxygenase, beta subunit